MIKKWYLETNQVLVAGSSPSQPNLSFPSEKKGPYIDIFLSSYTKSSLLLDFSRGAQRVSPVCCGLLLSSDGQGARK